MARRTEVAGSCPSMEVTRYTPLPLYESLVGGPQSADKKFVRARGPQNWNPEVFDQTGVRESCM